MWMTHCLQCISIEEAEYRVIQANRYIIILYILVYWFSNFFYDCRGFFWNANGMSIFLGGWEGWFGVDADLYLNFKLKM